MSVLGFLPLTKSCTNEGWVKNLAYTANVLNGWPLRGFYFTLNREITSAGLYVWYENIEEIEIWVHKVYTALIHDTTYQLENSINVLGENDNQTSNLVGKMGHCCWEKSFFPLKASEKKRFHASNNIRVEQFRIERNKLNLMGRKAFKQNYTFEN